MRLRKDRRRDFSNINRDHKNLKRQGTLKSNNIAHSSGGLDQSSETRKWNGKYATTTEGKVLMNLI
jgi:hypothetical protein